MSDRFAVEADHRVVGIAVRVKGGFRFFTADRHFRSLESRIFPKLKAVIARATEIALARKRRLAEQSAGRIIDAPPPDRAVAKSGGGDADGQAG